MIKSKDIKPIPNYIAKIIKQKSMNGFSNFYSYLTKIKGELARITVACKEYDKQWLCKQVAVHGVHSKNWSSKRYGIYNNGLWCWLV